MLRLIFILVFLFPVTDIREDLGLVLRKHQFTETHRKTDIPLKKLQAFGIDQYSEIANPGEPWEPGCTVMPGIPRHQLCWAASDAAGNWLINYKTGGWALIENVVFLPIAADTALFVYPEPRDSTFGNFRQDFLSGKLQIIH